MMLTNYRKSDWLFYLGWIAAGAISIPIAWNIAWAIISQITRIVGDTIVVDGQKHITEDFIFMYVLVPLLGLVMGTLQYFVLRRYVPRVAWWAGVTALGWVLPMSLLYLFRAGLFPGLGLDPVWSGAIAFSVIGASIGLCQWWVLRGRVHHAAWWVLFSIVGWGIAGAVSGENISSYSDVVALALVPPIVASLAWWLLLDKLPSGEHGRQAAYMRA